MSALPPKSGHVQRRRRCLQSANSGHLPLRLLAVTGRCILPPVPSWRGDGLPMQPTQLAAILSADVVGYSRLMAANEGATVETIKSYRDIIARLVVCHGGRVVKAPGEVREQL